MAQGARRPLRSTRQSQQKASSKVEIQSSQRQYRCNDDIKMENVLAALCSKPQFEGNTNEELIRSNLPHITSSVELDLELYAFLGIVINLCIHSWYDRITPDRQLNDELTGLIIACLQNLQQRLAKIDVQALLLDDISAIVTSHLEAVEIASRKHSIAEKRAVFHAIRPHPALHPVPISASTISLQQENEVIWTQLVVDKILPQVLSTENVQNPGLVVLVQEIFSEMILHNGLCEKVSQPWFLWESITRVLTPTQIPSVRRTTSVLLFVWNAILAVFSLLMILLGRATEETMPAVLIWLDNTIKAARLSDRPSAKRPVLDAHIWTATSTLLQFDRRMPWLAAGLSLLRWQLIRGPIKVGGNDRTLDRWIRMQLDQYILNPSILPSILRITRQSLFPGGTFGPARTIPNPDEMVSIRAECGSAVLDSIPVYIRTIYFATNDRDIMLSDVDHILEVIADPYINKALIIAITELILARLFTELQ